jgi:tRNA modification GTPase
MWKRIDFPDEEIDFLSDGKIEAQLNNVISDLDAVRAEARQGSLLREGMKVVIAGRPNAGKSSLLNALAGREAAIVTDIAGTTRDVLREHIHIDGMPLHIIDTAGLRDASDEVERIGIERAWQEIEQADRVLFMVDGTTTDAVDPADIWPDFIARLPAKLPITVVRNKADITGETLGLSEVNGHSLVRLSARTGEGVDVLRNHLKQSMGFETNMEGGFLARRRHLQALAEAAEHLEQGKAQLLGAWAGELLAESCVWRSRTSVRSPGSLPPTICWDGFSPASVLVSNVVLPGGAMLAGPTGPVGRIRRLHAIRQQQFPCGNHCCPNGNSCS